MQMQMQIHLGLTRQARSGKANTQVMAAAKLFSSDAAASKIAVRLTASSTAIVNVHI
jgi:hypothetical protein